jgi:SMI1 / KNR4 family (SUKH-1)
LQVSSTYIFFPTFPKPEISSASGQFTLLLGILMWEKLPALFEQHGKCHTRGVTHQPLLMERGNQMTEKTQASLLLRILEKAQQEKPRGLRKQWYPPASQEQVQATEEALGLALPPLLRACYLQISNGGFGPGEGVMGVIGGFEDNRGNIVDASLWRKK